MSKYIFQLRRGWKGKDKDGKTTYPDGTPIDDWGKYEDQEDHMKPLEGEVVLEYDNGIPRLKIGDGIHEFSELPYMSVDSFIVPKPTKIALYGGDKNWKPVGEDNSKYRQEITGQLAGKITKNSKVDLQPTPEQLYSFQVKDVTFTTVNSNGRVWVYAIGTMPMYDYEMQVMITEVTVDE